MIKFNNFLLLSIITLFFSYGSTKLSSFASPNHNHSLTEPKMEMKKDHHGHGDDHEHKSLDISQNADIPTIEIEVTPDVVKGWNLQIKTTNFTFTPEKLNQASNPNQGHGHLYINGKKVTRIYSDWYYIPNLPEAENEIKVTLNTDQHEDLVYQGRIISDQIVIKSSP